ncbi:hypothetical protein PM02_16725 [Sulfitobacter mediterraneus]|uniref:Uncharacterized protein n=2 Tax=Sulfitobacter mediterraneus TaxID=83219 RepID=A0A061SRQ5_9RHOB|nr:hypothetical protein PM02_16725 [Sulfitobacter mediterraneus]
MELLRPPNVGFQMEIQQQEAPMAERHRSQDGSKDSEKILGDTTQISQQGRSGGDLQRDVATQDEEKRAIQRPAGATRVTGKDKRNHGGAA